MEDKQRSTFIFYRSFYDAIIDMPEEHHALMFKAIFEYSLNNNIIELKGICKTIFTLIKPILDANNTRYDNGKKGGKKPKEETETKPKRNRTVTETKPKPNQEVTEVKPNGNRNETETIPNKDKDNNKDKNKDVDVEETPPTTTTNSFIKPPKEQTQDDSYLPIEQCRDIYDTFHTDKKNTLCVMKHLNREQFTKLQDEFDESVKAKESSKVVSDYIKHFANWLNTVHGEERIKELKKPQKTDVQKRMEFFGY